MINKDGGGGQSLDFMGGHSCYEGGHRAHGGSPQSPPLGKTLQPQIQDFYIRVLTGNSNLNID